MRKNPADQFFSLLTGEWTITGEVWSDIWCTGLWGSYFKSLGFQWEERPEEGWSESPSQMSLVSLVFLLLVLIDLIWTICI